MIKLDHIFSSVSAFGIPAFVFYVATLLSGWVGAAAITTALSVLGGPLGMTGGIFLLLIMVLATQVMSRHIFEAFYTSRINSLKTQGKTQEEIYQIVAGYRVSEELKGRLRSRMGQNEVSTSKRRRDTKRGCIIASSIIGVSFIVSSCMCSASVIYLIRR